MKLNEFNLKKSQTSAKALKEHFNTDLDTSKLNLQSAQKMLVKVRSLVSEMKSTSAAHASEQNPAYLKALFMEQTLTHHVNELKALPQRIVVENEQVEKSQVILAAQEMVDSMQKMIEQVSDMLVKELPAVVDGVNSEVGTNEGQQFQDQVTQALTSLQAALTGSKTGLTGALAVVTGSGAADMGMDAGADMGMGDEMSDVSVEEPDMMGGEEDLGAEMPEEEPEELSSVGRATR
jgi:hypothetical protein